MQPDVKSNPVAPDNGPFPPAVPPPTPAIPGSDPALPERYPAGSPLNRPQAPGVTDAPPAKSILQLRKVWVLIAGTSVIVFAIVIAPLPGPGFTIIAPIGFAMLASEFMWAKRLVNELEHRTGFIERGAAFFVRTRNWWFLPILIAIYWGLVFWLAFNDVLNPKYLFPVAGGLFAPLGYLAWRTIVHWWNARKLALENAQNADR